MHDAKLFLTVTETLYNVDEISTRDRVMMNHKILNKKALTKDFPLVCLQGQIIRETDGSTPFARFTTTSPIKSCQHIGDGRALVTTCSGSKYEIYTSQAEAELLNHCNPWIDGDNWKTI